MTHRLEQDELYHELAQAHGGAMVRLANSTEANADKRLDLLQMMNVELWKSLKRFDGRCSKKTWVYRVIHNVAASYVRAETRRRRPSVSLDDIELPSQANTHSQTEKRDALERLYRWIRVLDMPDRQILLLYLEDLAAADIADVTGLTARAVSTRISRLKSKLTNHHKETPYD